jgi:hypothetical protein
MAVSSGWYDARSPFRYPVSFFLLDIPSAEVCGFCIDILRLHFSEKCALYTRNLAMISGLSAYRGYISTGCLDFRLCVIRLEFDHANERSAFFFYHVARKINV